MVYDKHDDSQNVVTRLQIPQVIFVDKSRTADYQTTYGLLDILHRNGNHDDVIAISKNATYP